MKTAIHNKFPNHIIYSDGKVYSQRIKRFVKIHKNSNGYCRITISKDKHVLLHRLVLEAFRGPPPEDMLHPTCNHIDGNKMNNSIDNLEWMERKQNIALGNKNTVSQEKQDKIIELYNTGKYSYRSIGRIVGHDHHTVKRYILRKATN